MIVLKGEERSDASNNIRSFKEIDIPYPVIQYIEEHSLYYIPKLKEWYGDRYNHVKNVAELSHQIAKNNGFNPQKAYIAGFLHDLGKKVHLSDTTKDYSEEIKYLNTAFDGRFKDLPPYAIELEPVVLPSRFPNLFVNGTEGIAVALATEIPPHNLREVIEATVYRITHKTATIEDLMQIVKGPDFPGGGYIYNSDGLKNIYLNGRGRIELSAKCEIVSNRDNQQIVITEIPYKVVKIQLVYEIDKIIHSKAVDGMLEVRDESDWKGIRIVIDCRKDAKCDLLLKYLMSKTSLVCGYSANMVAIVNGRPKTINLLDYIDAYIAHQVDVVTRKSKFELQKASDRLHIVEGLILASLNINEVVDIIKKSKDKADSKVNLIARYSRSHEKC